MSPAAAILVVDFWIIRRRKWNIPQLYQPGGIYWFHSGVNWRAFIAYTLGMWPALPVSSPLTGTHTTELISFPGFHQCRLRLVGRNYLAAILPDQLLLRLYRLGVAVLRIQPTVTTAGARRAGGF